MMNRTPQRNMQKKTANADMLTQNLQTVAAFARIAKFSLKIPGIFLTLRSSGNPQPYCNF
jgi:hypothetical protein